MHKFVYLFTAFAGLIFDINTSAQECNNASPADIVFIIDGSSSVGPVNFNLSLRFVTRLLDAFTIGPTDTQVALIIFTGSAEVQFNFNTHTDAQTLKSAITDTECPYGGTKILVGIQKAIDIFKRSSESGHRPGTTGIAILMTDGKSSNIEQSIQAARELEKLDVTIYTAGIGSSVNATELQQVASKPSYYFHTNDYNALDSISGPLASSACSDLDGCICFNGGNCTSDHHGSTCICPAIYTGVYCEKPICDTSPCVYGNCGVSGDRWYCSCQSGYTGMLCGEEINECESSPCENGGICLDWVNAFSCDCPPRYYGIYCETGICQPSVADIVFVLDSSSSQTKAEFEKQLEFISQFIDHIVIGERNFQVGVVTYSFKAVTEISLGEFQDNVTLKEAVRKIKYRPGATFTDKGLEEAKMVFDKAPRQRPYGHTAKRFAFVLTDGLSTHRASTAKAAYALRSTIDKVLAVGIGNEVSHRELVSIASTEDTGTGRKYVYSVQNFNALYTVVKELVRLTCDECYWKTSSDVLFLVDMSTTVSVRDFQTGLNAVTYLVYRTTQMETENNTVRIALLTYGTGVQLQRALDDSETKQNFLSSMQKLVLPEGDCPAGTSDCETTNLDIALRFANQHVFDRMTQSTNEKREIVIILSNGQQPITNEIIAELENLRKSGKDVYVIALGTDADIENLKRIIGDPALVFSVYDEESTNSLDALTTEFFFSSCDLTNDFLNG